MRIARRYYISGIVQGVGFRYFVQRSAAKHQVRGFVRNLPDGRVEAYAEGSEAELKGFHEDLLAGPTYSVVEAIEELVEETTNEFSSFRIER